MPFTEQIFAEGCVDKLAERRARTYGFTLGAATELVIQNKSSSHTIIHVYADLQQASAQTKEALKG